MKLDGSWCEGVVDLVALLLVDKASAVQTDDVDRLSHSSGATLVTRPYRVGGRLSIKLAWLAA